MDASLPGIDVMSELAAASHDADGVLQPGTQLLVGSNLYNFPTATSGASVAQQQQQQHYHTASPQQQQQQQQDQSLAQATLLGGPVSMQQQQDSKLPLMVSSYQPSVNIDTDLWNCYMKPIEVGPDGVVKCLQMKFVEGMGFMFPAGQAKYWVAYPLETFPLYGSDFDNSRLLSQQLHTPPLQPQAQQPQPSQSPPPPQQHLNSGPLNAMGPPRTTSTSGRSGMNKRKVHEMFLRSSVVQTQTQTHMGGQGGDGGGLNMMIHQDSASAAVLHNQHRGHGGMMHPQQMGPHHSQGPGGGPPPGLLTPNISQSVAPPVNHLDPLPRHQQQLLDQLYDLFGGRTMSVRSGIKVSKLTGKISRMVDLLESYSASIHDIHVWSSHLQSLCKQEGQVEPFQFNRGLFGNRFSKILYVLVSGLAGEFGLQQHQTVGKWASIIERNNNKARVTEHVESLDKDALPFLKEVLSGNTRTLLKVLSRSSSLQEANAISREELLAENPDS